MIPYEKWELKIIQDVVDDYASGGTVGREVTQGLLDDLNQERNRRGLIEERNLGSLEYKFYQLLQKAKE